MSRDKDKTDLLREIEAKHRGDSEIEVAHLVYGQMGEIQRRSALLAALAEEVWEIRRARQLEVEREASREVIADIEQREQDRLARLNDETEERRRQQDAQRQAWHESVYQTFKDRMLEIHEEVLGWVDHPLTFPDRLDDVLKDDAQRHHWILPNSAHLLLPFLKSDSPMQRLMGFVHGNSLLKEDDYIRGFFWNRTEWFKALMVRDGLSYDDMARITSHLALGYLALNYAIEGEIRERAESMALEISEKFLASEFALGDGVRVTWGDATIEDHEVRAAMTTKNAVANAEDAARHRAAIRMLNDAGVETLGQLASSSAA